MSTQLVEERSAGRDRVVTETRGSLSMGLLGRLILRYAPTSLLPAATGLLSIIVFTRVLNSVEYGRYSLALSASILVTSVCSQWLQHGINRYLPAARRTGGIRHLKGGAVVALACIIAIEAALGGVALVGARFLDSEWERVIAPAIVLTLATSIFWPLGSILQAELRAGRYSLYHSVNSLLRFGLALALLYIVTPEPASLLWGFAIATLAVIPVVWWDAGISSLRWMGARIRRLSVIGIRLARYGIPMAGWVLAATTLEFGDRYVIQFVRGSAEMGIYAANYSLVSAGVGLVAAPVLLAAHPFLMRAWERQDPDAAGQWLSTIAEWFTLTGIFLVGLVFLFARDLANLLLGAEFREGYHIIPIVLAGAILWQLGMYTHKPLEFSGRTRLLFGLSITAAAVNIALNIALVPVFGYPAAAYTTLATYALYAIITTRAGLRLLRWQVRWQRSAGVLAVVGVSLLAVMAVRDWTEQELGYPAGLALACVLTAILYAGILARLLPSLLRSIPGRST